MQKFVCQVAAVMCAAAACVALDEGRLVGLAGYVLLAAGLGVGANYVARKKQGIVRDDDDVVQFGWGTHESMRQVPK